MLGLRNLSKIILPFAEFVSVDVRVQQQPVHHAQFPVVDGLFAEGVLSVGGADHADSGG